MNSERGHGSRRQRLRRRLGELPVFPTLLTAGNLACGVTAIFFAASSQDFLFAGAILIFVAMFCDMLDGKVARMTNTEGEFGAELDSLADVVSFGVAPAMLVHRTVLGEGPGKVWGDGESWMTFVVIIYAVLTAIRLARYNVEHRGDTTTTVFKGLPSPGAAAFLCSWVLFYAYFTKTAETDPTWLIALIGLEYWIAGFGYFISAATLAMAALMVSSVGFPHFGNVFLGGRLSFGKLVLVLPVVGLFVMHPLYGMIFGTSAYIVIGVIGWLRGFGADEIAIPDEDMAPEAETGNPAG